MFEYDPFSKEVRENPHAIYPRLRDEAPAYHLERYNAWALSRFEDVWSYSSHPAFSTAKGTTPAQVLTKDQPVTPMLNVMDPPDHTKLRAAIRGAFLPRNLRRIEPAVREVLNGLLDEVMDRGECDLIEDVASRLSVQVACMGIGLPAEDGPYLTDLVQRFFHHDPDQEGFTEDAFAALTEMAGYCTEKVIEKRKSGGDDGLDALSKLVKFELDGRQFGDEEAGSHVTMLVIGGSETFPKTLASGLVRLWEHPDQRAQLAQDPSGVPDAYDEILRYDMPTQFLCRTLTEDVEMHGQTLREGEGVMFLYASANRDPREFENPDVFDIKRKPPRLLTFGAGTHACLGTHVARLEGKVCLESILSRIPEYEVDLENASRFKTEFVQGYASLPIRWS